MLAIYSPILFLLIASATTLASISPRLFYVDLLWIAGAGVIAALMHWLGWRVILGYRWIPRVLYLIAILFLISVFVFPAVRHVHSWITLGTFTFQPVELAKLALIFMFAEYFSRRHISVARPRRILHSFLIFAVPGALTILQPALGSAIILFAIWFSFLIWSGLPIRRVLVTMTVIAVLGAIFWGYGLKDFQRDRITGFLAPERDVLGINYNVTQSRIAIGSAGPWGKGFGQGTQTQLGFLPEPESDFILAAFAEEWGYVGAAAVLAAFLFLELALLRVASRARENFERFAVLGIVTTLGVQFVLNAGSATGLLPVVGVPFPFFSYGGSSLITSVVLVSVAAAIERKG